MLKINNWLITTLREVMSDPGFSGTLRSGSTTICQLHNGAAHTPNYSRWIEIIQGDKVVALIEPNVQRISFYNADTIPARSRINALLAEFNPFVSLRYAKGALNVFDRNDNPTPFHQGYFTSFDPWHPLRASAR